MTEFEKKCLDLAISEAEKSFNLGNYPVGAVLSFNEDIVSSSGNFGETSKNYINHAETKLLIANGEALLKSSKEGKTVTIYSTLEPCLMCLGLAVMNKVNKIIYLQKDPHAGACGIDRNNLGVRYQEVWPEISLENYSQKPKELIVNFLNNQINKGVRVEWSQKFLELLKNLD